MLGMIGLVFAHKTGRSVADRIGVKEARVIPCEFIDRFVASCQRLRVIEAARPADGAEEVVKSPLHGPRISGFAEIGSDVPLPAHVGAITGRFQHLRNGRAILAQIARISLGSRIISQDADPGLVRMQAGQQRRPRRAAPGSIVELRIAQTLAREPIEIWGLNFATKAAEVGEPHVVVQYQDNVGLRHDLSSSGALCNGCGGQQGLAELAGLSCRTNGRQVRDFACGLMAEPVTS